MTFSLSARSYAAQQPDFALKSSAATSSAKSFTASLGCLGETDDAHGWNYQGKSLIRVRGGFEFAPRHGDPYRTVPNVQINIGYLSDEEIRQLVQELNEAFYAKLVEAGAKRFPAIVLLPSQNCNHIHVRRSRVAYLGKQGIRLNGADILNKYLALQRDRIDRAQVAHDLVADALGYARLEHYSAFPRDLFTENKQPIAFRFKMTNKFDLSLEDIDAIQGKSNRGFPTGADKAYLSHAEDIFDALRRKYFDVATFETRCIFSDFAEQAHALFQRAGLPEIWTEAKLIKSSNPTRYEGGITIHHDFKIEIPLISIEQAESMAAKLIDIKDELRPVIAEVVKRASPTSAFGCPLFGFMNKRSPEADLQHHLSYGIAIKEIETLRLSSPRDEPKREAAWEEAIQNTGDLIDYLTLAQNDSDQAIRETASRELSLICTIAPVFRSLVQKAVIQHLL